MRCDEKQVGACGNGDTCKPYDGVSGKPLRRVSSDTEAELSKKLCSGISSIQKGENFSISNNAIK